MHTSAFSPSERTEPAHASSLGGWNTLPVRSGSFWPCTELKQHGDFIRATRYRPSSVSHWITEFGSKLAVNRLVAGSNPAGEPIVFYLSGFFGLPCHPPTSVPQSRVSIVALRLNASPATVA